MFWVRFPNATHAGAQAGFVAGLIATEIMKLYSGLWTLYCCLSGARGKIFDSQLSRHATVTRDDLWLGLST